MINRNAEKVVPADFPELKLLAWGRDPDRPILRNEAFELYERNWRHVDVERLTPEEADLIEDLTQKFGGGHRMFA